MPSHGSLGKHHGIVMFGQCWGCQGLQAVSVHSPRALSSLWLQSCAGVAPVTGILVWRAALFGKDRPGRHRGAGGNIWNVSKSVLGWVVSGSGLRALLVGQSGKGDLLWVLATGPLSTEG